MFILPRETEMTLPLLQEFLDKHRREVNDRYKKLKAAYESDHDILHQAVKPAYKPDNRIVVNFPKYITDTMNGFFIGNPIKTVADDEAVSDFVEYLDQYNDQDDNNAELSKICSIFGKGYEMYYTDENSELCITYLSPIEAFMIFDDSIIERPMFFVRRYTDRENNEYGSISDKYGVRNFKVTGGLRWLDEDWAEHHFPGVPATEYVENAERQGIFEPILSMVVENEDMQHIRDNRVVNFVGEDAEKLIVEFMDKPSSDTTQENLLERLERLIFNISMVANISDENFGASSGIALKYKLQAMSNLEKTKERKFTSGMNRRYKLLFGHPSSKVAADAWIQLHYQFTPNIPNNLLEEAQIAAQMEGTVSKKTQLKVLSIVDNVDSEIEALEEESSALQQAAVQNTAFGAPTAEGEAAQADEVLNNEQ